MVEEVQRADLVVVRLVGTTVATGVASRLRDIRALTTGVTEGTVVRFGRTGLTHLAFG